MTQQSKRRKKRYEPGSAYAGTVKPVGVLGFLGSPRTMRVVFLVMALALAAGGAGALLSSKLDSNASNPSNPDFVKPSDVDGTGTPNAQATVTVKQYTSAPALTIDPSKTYVATIKTSAGDIEVELLASEVPQTVNNFVFLAKDGFYDGLTFYHVSAGFDAQAGDPNCRAEQSGVGCTGRGGPGYDLPQEKPEPFAVGTIGMANASQFFIALDESPQFDQYTPFGRITSGLEVAQQLVQGSEITSIEIAEQ